MAVTGRTTLALVILLGGLAAECATRVGLVDCERNRRLQKIDLSSHTSLEQALQTVPHTLLRVSY